MVPVSARADLAACPGAGIAGQAALGIPDGRDLTVTGGMPFAGGPFNNYVFQATCRAAELLRLRGNSTALVSSVSGLLTKQGFGLWSTTPAAGGFVHADVTETVAREVATCDVLDVFSGDATVADYTVLYGRGQSPRAIALVDIDPRQRALTTTDDPVLIARLEREEFVGRRVRIKDNVLL
ncbi:MAG: hypothetical protein HYX63_20610 [Gammaproteobacteria bacterium]|nr:hypothetical protein [Gammaproteobacteria bacterium]